MSKQPTPTITVSTSTPNKTVRSENDLTSATQSLSPFIVNRQDLSSPTSPYMSRSDRKGEASGKLKESRQTVDAFKQFYTSAELKNEQLQAFMTMVREKLGVSAGPFQAVKDLVMESIEELMKYRRLYEVEKAEKEKALSDLKEEREKLSKCMEVFNKNTEDIIEEAKGFLENNEFVFKKAAVNAIMKGMKIKAKDMAQVEKVHLDYREKKVVVEYFIEEKELNRENKDDEDENKVFEEWNRNAKGLLKAVRRLGKKFVKINYFMLYNITDFYRFIKEKDSKNPVLVKIYSELEEKEKELNSLSTQYDDLEASETKELFALGFMAKMRTFFNDMSGWWDTNFKVMKDLYQDLSNNTMYIIHDMQDKLLMNLEKSSPR